MRIELKQIKLFSNNRGCYIKLHTQILDCQHVGVPFIPSCLKLLKGFVYLICAVYIGHKRSVDFIITTFCHNV